MFSLKFTKPISYSKQIKNIIIKKCKEFKNKKYLKKKKSREKKKLLGRGALIS